MLCYCLTSCFPPKIFERGRSTPSLLHSRFKCRHATFLWRGTLRDDAKNGCVADYSTLDGKQFYHVTSHSPWENTREKFQLSKIIFSSDRWFFSQWHGFSIFLFPSLLELCSLPSRDSLQKLIVASLDYSHSGIPRIILSKILTASSPVFTMY